MLGLPPPIFLIRRPNSAKKGLENLPYLSKNTVTRSMVLSSGGEMGQASRQIVAQWGLDRFVSGVLTVLEIPRRPDAGFLSNLLTRLWKGRVRVH